MNVTVGPIPVSNEQKENWKELAASHKRSLAKQIEHELDTACEELQQKISKK